MVRMNEVNKLVNKGYKCGELMNVLKLWTINLYVRLNEVNKLVNEGYNCGELMNVIKLETINLYVRLNKREVYNSYRVKYIIK